jgi:hypothetical protein
MAEGSDLAERRVLSRHVEVLRPQRANPRPSRHECAPHLFNTDAWGVGMGEGGGCRAEGGERGGGGEEGGRGGERRGGERKFSALT